MKRIAALLAALVLGLAVPAIATAQFGPTNVPAPLTQSDESDQEVAPEEDTGLSTLQLVLIFGAVVGVVAAIAFVILRDARQSAPAAARAAATEAAAGGAGGAGGTPKQRSAREREREKARKRNKAKAARNQRKRNRRR